MNSNQPLWLPKGSIRAILALVIVAPIAVILIRSSITFSADQAIGLASLILAAYFVDKARSGT